VADNKNYICLRKTKHHEADLFVRN